MVLIAATCVCVLSLVWPLPEATRDRGNAASLRVTDRHGQLLREVFPDGRSHPVMLEDVEPALVEALLATEDRRFRRHLGIDPLAIGRALVQNARAGRTMSGGSTLTMQVARALRPTARRGITSKLAEAHLALRLEARLSKDEILALWLNRVSFGNRAVGIGAAAQTYFGTSARSVTIDQAALLVGLPQGPSRLDPFRHPERALTRRNTVLDAMARAGSLSPAEIDRLRGLPLGVIEPRRAFHAPHFAEWVASEAPPESSEIRTTIDLSSQVAVERIVRNGIRSLRENHATAAAAVVIDNVSGSVVAYVGSPDFWNEDAAGQVDGVRALRQPGSALKPFTYGLAFQTGRITSATILPDLDVQILEAGGAFSPENYDRRFHGPVSARVALGSSLNVPAVRVARGLGPEAVLAALRQAGFSSLNRNADHYGVGLTLGNGEVRLLDLAYAYAGLARGGSLPSQRTIAWSVSMSGDTLFVGTRAPSTMSISPAVAYLVTDILADDEARAIGFGRGGVLQLPFPAAVKTGTSKDYRDNWAVGFTPQHTVAVWVGNFDGRPMRLVSGIRGSGPMLNQILQFLGSGGAFSVPAGVAAAEICPASGHRPGASCPGARREWFLSESVPTDTCSVHRLIEIDRRTGLLADSGTPTEATDRRRFLVYPPEYHAWMSQRGMPLPPTATSTTAAHKSPRYSDRLRVDYPTSGTVFHLDPVLRADFQRARLRGHADDGLLNAEWYVGGVAISSDVHGTDWQLTTGVHEIELRALSPDGRRLRSLPSLVTVRGTAHRAALTE